ncbi:MAG TPA: hypothetical protein VJ165_02395 [candidate division Zixibacteria bacterium]|nr:hypothetical protein [candidate division Zixibacteria bacterium]
MKFRAITKLIILSALLLICGLTCTKSKVDQQSKPDQMTNKPIEEVLKEHTPHLMSIPGVTGTAQGELDGKPCIKVYVVKETEELKKQVPKEIEGYPVEIQESGVIKPMNDD